MTRLAHRLVDALRLLPLFHVGRVLRLLAADARSVLDVGIGNGEVMRLLGSRRQLDSVGLEIFPPYIEHCRRRGIHRAYVCGDLRNLPFRPRSFDAVLALEVLEHLEKPAAEKALQELERVARHQVILSMPVGFEAQDAYDANVHQTHRSEWLPAELRARGYTVRGGAGPKLLTNVVGLESRMASMVRALSPLVYWFPGLASAMYCVKRVRKTDALWRAEAGALAQLEQWKH